MSSLWRQIVNVQDKKKMCLGVCIDGISKYRLVVVICIWCEFCNVATTNAYQNVASTPLSSSSSSLVPSLPWSKTHTRPKRITKNFYIETCKRISNDAKKKIYMDETSSVSAGYFFWQFFSSSFLFRIWKIGSWSMQTGRYMLIALLGLHKLLTNIFHEYTHGYENVSFFILSFYFFFIFFFFVCE